jgi:hypothetical protein
MRSVVRWSDLRALICASARALACTAVKCRSRSVNTGGRNDVWLELCRPLGNVEAHLGVGRVELLLYLLECPLH